MNDKLIIANDSLYKWLDYFKENNYKYIVKVKDKFLSGWGLSQNKAHIQLIACKNVDHLEKVLKRVKSDSTFSNVNWWFIEDKKAINNTIRNKTYTIRNDFN